MINILSYFCFHSNFLLIKILCQCQKKIDIGITYSVSYRGKLGNALPFSGIVLCVHRIQRNSFNSSKYLYEILKIDLVFKKSPGNNLKI